METSMGSTGIGPLLLDLGMKWNPIAKTGIGLPQEVDWRTFIENTYIAGCWKIAGQ